MHDRPCGAALKSQEIISSPGEDGDCHCVEGIGGVRVCQCFHDGIRTVTAMRGVDTLRLLVDSTRWGPHVTQVVTGDLDGDSVPDLVVPVLTAYSNGMGVTHWTLYDIPHGDLGRWDIDSLKTEEYNARGAWVRSAGEVGCSLIAGRWIGGDAPQGHLDGLYFEATWYRFGGGRLSIRPDRPVLRRRYTYAFQRERLRTQFTTAPLSWLLSSKAHP